MALILLVPFNLLRSSFLVRLMYSFAAFSFVLLWSTVAFYSIPGTCKQHHFQGLWRFHLEVAGQHTWPTYLFGELPWHTCLSQTSSQYRLSLSSISGSGCLVLARFLPTAWDRPCIIDGWLAVRFWSCNPSLILLEADLRDSLSGREVAVIVASPW